MDSIGDGAMPVEQNGLAWLIHPLGLSEFKRDFYEQRLCLVSRDDPGYYRKLLTHRDLDVVLGTHNVGDSDIRLVHGEDDIPKGAYTGRSGRIDPLGVVNQFDRGATIIFNQLHRRVPKLSEFCASLGKVFGSRVQANVYLTPPNAQGFKPHWDTHDVFVLQVSGQKHWSVYDTKVALPLRGQSFDAARDPPGPVTEQFELAPGSAAYVPRGLMHSARSNDEASLHITVGITTFTWTELFLEGAAAAGIRDVSLRQSLPFRFVHDDFPAEERDRLLQDKLEALRSRLIPGEVWGHFRSWLQAENAPLFTDLLSSRLWADTAKLASRVRRRPGLLVAFDNGGDGCALCFGGQELTFPDRMRVAVAFVASTDEFTVSDLPGLSQPEEKVALADRLVRDGLLQVVP